MLQVVGGGIICSQWLHTLNRPQQFKNRKRAWGTCFKFFCREFIAPLPIFHTTILAYERLTYTDIDCQLYFIPLIFLNCCNASPCNLYICLADVHIFSATSSHVIATLVPFMLRLYFPRK